MTLIMAYTTEEASYIASDTLGSDGYTKDVYRNKKIFRKEDMLIGGAGSYRQLQLLEHVFEIPPKCGSESIEEYMYTNFHPKLVWFLKDSNVISTNKGVDSNEAGEFIFLYRNRMFVMQNDLSILEPSDAFVCIGSGEDHAYAVLKALKEFDMPVEAKLKKALSITSDLVTSVGGKLQVLKVPVSS